MLATAGQKEEWYDSDPPVTPEGPTKPADDIELLSSKDFLTPETSL